MLKRTARLVFWGIANYISNVLSSDLTAGKLAKEEPCPARAISPTDHLEPTPEDNNRAGQVLELKVSLFSILNRCYVVDIYFAQVI